MTYRPKILIVEDDIELQSLLGDYLSEQGFDVVPVFDGAAAMRRLHAASPDLVILDLMLPGMDGFEVCRSIRPGYQGPILMMTARKADVDQIVGLEIGADDYITKPVKPRVLVARIRALLRRTGEVRPDTGDDKIRVGMFIADRAQREAFVEQSPLGLTGAEFDIVWLLARRCGSVVSRDELYRSLRGHAYDGQDRGMDIHLARVRRKLKDVGFGGTLIKSVRGVGYQMVRNQVAPG